MDSVLAVMPQMNDSEKDSALKLLIDLTVGAPDERHYTRMYIDFAATGRTSKAKVGLC